MSNLSDLLPAGAAAKQLTFTDSGSGISSKAPVVLNSDGTVSAVSGNTQVIGTADTAVSASVFSQNAAYDSNSNRIVVVYRDANPFYGKAVVGTPSGTSISWGTPVTFQSSSTTQIGICFDSTENKIVIVYSDLGDSQYGKAIVGDVSGSTISFGSAVTFYSGTTSSSSCVYDTSNSKVVVAYYRSSGYADVGTVSGTSISFGTAVQYTANNITAISTVFDSSANKVIITYADNSSSGAGTSVVGTVSGTTMSFGSAAVWNSGDSGYQNSAYDASADRTLICYRDDGDSQIGKGIVAQVSGTSLTYGSETNLGTTNILPVGMAYDPDGNQVLVAYGSANDSYKGKFRRATVSGLTVSFSEEFTYLDGTDGGYIACVYNTTDDKGVIIFKNDSSSSYTQSVAVTLGSTNLTAQAFVGVADSAISASAAGSVIVQGGTVSGVSSGTGVSAGTAVQYSASNLADVYAADSVYDSTNNKVVVVYDGAGSGAGYGIVGTISGTSVSYGSAVQYSGGNAQHSQVTYDSTNQRVVVAYVDSANSGYLTVAVGTVSGTSISWGTPVVADSTVNDFYIGIDFDINAGKVLIIWKDNSTAYNYGIVGTVSGTSISFGTKATVDTSYGYQMIGGLTYDANAQKHLFFRPRTSGTVADGYVGTISGTSVSWGSATSATTTQSLSVGWGSYDSNAQKVVVTYRIGAGGMGSQVATISGTSVSFGTQVVVDASINPDFTTNYYDSTDQTIVAFGRATNYYGYIGTVSGTSISWSSASTLLLDAAFGYGLGTPAYDANADKGLILFANAGDSAAESAVTTAGALPLTTGTKYYVTTSGGFSSSADTPSVNAGLAISTTSLLLNGDS